MNKKIKRLKAFTLAEGGHSPLLCGDEGTQGSPRLVKRGFTLAEVLITLGVIGVVAAVTMPTVIKNYQKKQTVTQLKKAYSKLSQAISMAQKDLGLMEDWDFANFPTAADRAQYFYDNALKPYLKIVKYCAPSSNNCWEDDSYTLTRTKYTQLNNAVQGHNSFITTSGYSVFYWLHGGGTGGWFFVDLNGTKEPNTLGKDIFVFMLDSTRASYKAPKVGFIPQGMYRLDEETNMLVPSSRDDIITGNYSTATAAGSCSKTGIRNQGLTCAALIMVDGWEIKDDYPW